VTDQRYQGTFPDADCLARFLHSRGFSLDSAAAKARLFAQCAGALGSLTDVAPERWQAHWVPGRIEVLGKHTDYAGGSSMVVAAERGFCLIAAGVDDSQVIITDVARDETALVSMAEDLAVPAGHWSNYPKAVVRRLARNFPDAKRGVRIALASDLPPAAGMSSSSALMIAVFLALAEANDLWTHPNWPDELQHAQHLAGYLATIENGRSYGVLTGDSGVGTFGGSEDHTAILCARAGHICQFAYCPVRFEQEWPVPKGYTFAVAASGVIAEKTGAAREQYNRASLAAAAIVDLWNRHTGRTDGQLAAALRRQPSAARQLRDLLSESPETTDAPKDLSRRLEHFLVENDRVISAAGNALRQGDFHALGHCVDRSQRAAEQLLGNQVPETCYLAAAARQHGAIAASSFGAGFGGSVWALVAAERVEAMLAAWRAGYLARFPEHAERCEFFVTAAGPPTFRLT
jgi:galactokinase